MVAATGNQTAASRGSTSGRKNEGNSGSGNSRDGGTRGGVGSGGGTGRGNANSGGGSRSSGAGGAGGVRGSSGAQHESHGSVASSSRAGAGPSSSSRSGGRDPGVGGVPGGISARGQSNGGLMGRGSLLSNPSVVSQSVSRPGSYAGPKGALSLNEAARNAALPVSTPRSYAGPKGLMSLSQPARMASARAAGYPNIPSISASPAEIDLATRIALAEHSSILNPLGGIQTPALQAVADVARNRVLSSRYPNTLGGVLTQKAQFSPYNSDVRASLAAYGPRNPNYAATRSMVESVMSGETAPVVGNSLNYSNLHTVNNPQAVSNPSQRASTASRDAFNSMPVENTFVSAANPNMQASFGTIGLPSDVNLRSAIRSPNTQVVNGSLGNSLPDAILSSAPRNTPGINYQENPGRFAGISQQQPKMQDRIAAEPSLNGLNIAQNAYDNARSAISPMSGQGVLGAPGLANMADLASRSPIGTVTQAGLNPMTGLSNSGLPNPFGNFSGPGVPSKMQDRLPQSNEDLPSWDAGPRMAGFEPSQQRSPYGPTPVPSRNPASGMAFTPGLPRNPIGGMSFSPGLPGMMPGPMRSRSPAVNGEPQIAQGIPDQPGIQQPLGTPRTAQMAGLGGFVSPTQTTQTNPANPVKPGSGLLAGLSNAFNDVKKAVTPSPENQDRIRKAFEYGRFLTPPGPKSIYAGGGEGRPLRGGQGGQVQWTGNETPSQVAQMQQHVEDVLRSYFTGELVNPPA